MSIKSKIFFFIAHFVLLFFISWGASLCQPMNTSKVVFIPKGSSADIISYLSLRNFNVNKLDKYILALFGSAQAGWVEIGTSRLSRLDFLYRLTKAKAALEEITLVPGETSEYFLKDISSKLGLKYELLLSELRANALFFEGFLVPDTYKIPLGMSEKHLIFYLVNLSKKIHEERSTKIFGTFNQKEWENYIIIASIIQKEAANEDEMPLVASVIYNRLKKGMKLQMDGTLNYGLYSHEKVTPQRIANDNTRFNTYKFAGLPEGAVCTVSMSAIRAAIFPKKTDYLYFVRDKKTGKHIFTTNYDAHVNAINAGRK